jgi:hypothetical protein
MCLRETYKKKYEEKITGILSVIEERSWIRIRIH